MVKVKSQRESVLFFGRRKYYYSQYLMFACIGIENKSNCIEGIEIKYGASKTNTIILIRK